MDSGQLILKKEENALKQKSYAFALDIVKACMLLQEKREYVLSKQLLRSGTAIGALVEEANQAESRADFIHKLSLANKEANETQYWIRLLIDSETITEEKGKTLSIESTELIKILTASIKTSKLKRYSLSIINCQLYIERTAIHI
jgi:four helix bundle protein